MNTSKQFMQQAKQHGIDVSLLAYNLSLSYEERLVQHQRALELVLALRDAGKNYYARLKQSPQDSH